MKNLAIFASYNASVMDSIYQACKNTTLDANISLIITNNSTANVLNKAQEYNIPSFIVNSKTDDNIDQRIAELLIEYKCEYIFLAGYMKKIDPFLVDKFEIINSHPALLPNYGGKGMYGRYIHEEVIKNKEKASGVTIHKVNENYDEGTIILQESILIDENETVESLESRIKALEQTVVVKALQKCLK